MAARPPQSNDDPDEPTAFGIVAVDDHLQDADLDFPASRREVVEALDDPSVRCSPSGREVDLSAVLERTGRQRFDSRQQLLDDLHDAFEAERDSGTGLVAWLRSLFGG
ncbi:hypothetical protein [Halobacterium yunchengense]|uniref:DUF5789 family protein n=1 Tax=Halobacterium yunchengense TaxID=3108497 RepID=UPI00300A8CD4